MIHHRGRSRGVARFALCVGVGALAWIATCGAASASNGSIDEQAPDYSATSLNSGASVSLTDLRGKVALINKWATWCGPCVKEMPDLEQLSQRHRGEDFVVVGVSIDRDGMKRSVASVANKRGVTYPIWLDTDDDFTPTFHSTGVPESVLLDKRGVVVMRWAGAIDVGEPAVERAIAAAQKGRGNYDGAARRDARDGISLGIAGLITALVAGLLSFLSPCVLPLVPSYVAFIAGVSDTSNESRRKNLALLNGVLFVLGFTTVFILLGLSTTAAGGLLRDNGEWLARIGGAMVIIFGCHLLGLFRIPFLNREFRALTYATGKPVGFATTYVVGGAFAAGWTPCIGPVLATILTLSATQASLGESAILLGAYSLGLAIPFLLATVALDQFLSVSKRARKWMPWVDRIAGAMLLALGALLITGAMTRLSAWFA